MSKTIEISVYDLQEFEREAIENKELREEIKKLKEERDFFEEQAILWRKDYKNEYEKNKKLEEDVDYRHHRAMKAERGED